MNRRALALLAAPVLVAACGGDGRTPLVVYSPHASELLSYYEERFEAAHPEVDVQWVDMGSQEVLDRLRAESVNPQADVWFGAPAEIFDRAGVEGLLTPYTPTWVEAVPPSARGDSALWFGTYLTPEVIAYNTEAVRPEDVPRDWADVVDPRWRGEVLIRDPIASGTMRAIFGGQLAQSVQRTGSPEAGFDWLRRLDANTKEYVLNPALLYQRLGRQEGSITLWDMPDIAMLKARGGFPIDYVVPASGTPVVVDGIAIVQGTENEALARRYYEFVTTEAALITAARQFMRIPARTDVPADSLPDWIRAAREEVKPLEIDQGLLADSLDAWMRYWDANIRNRYRDQ